MQRLCPDGRCIAANACCEDCGSGTCVGGVCQSPANVVAMPGSIDYGPVEVGAGQAQRDVIISNQGDQQSGVLAITEGGTGADFAFASDCPVVLAGRTSCTVTVIGFSATQAGQVEGQLVVTVGGTPLTVPLRATATSTAVAELVTSRPEGNPPGFDFGPTPVATRQQLTWEITNTGDAASGAFQIISNNSLDFDVTEFQTETTIAFCPSLAPGDACLMTITYEPQSIGAHSVVYTAGDFGLTFTASGSGI